ncbi:MAG: hypothetical protein Q8Q31_05605 [Nanoarchaeota archaeon]|nr:hypothetical protein [Nanoarchaeota archaeon]
MAKRVHVTPELILNPIYLDKAISESTGNIFLGSEDSMYDADKIDILHRGKVGPESVDLERMRGNRRVLSNIEKMLAQVDKIFFPGTLLRDYGGYTVPVMPIILNGRLVCERIKQTGDPYVDDYQRLAKERGMDPPKVNGFFDTQYENLMGSIRFELAKRRRDSLRHIDIEGANVLPIIGNELPLIPSMYTGPKLSAVLHSSCNYAQSCSDRHEMYEAFANAMSKKHLVNNPFTIIYSEHSSGDNETPSATGAFVYEGRKLRALDGAPQTPLHF